MPDSSGPYTGGTWVGDAEDWLANSIPGAENIDAVLRVLNGMMGIPPRFTPEEFNAAVQGVGGVGPPKYTVALPPLQDRPGTYRDRAMQGRRSENVIISGLGG